MTVAQLAVVGLVALLVLLVVVLMATFLVTITSAKPQGARPPWPMPGGQTRPQWREEWDPQVPFPSAPIAREWDEEEARQVAETVRAETYRPEQPSTASEGLMASLRPFAWAGVAACVALGIGWAWLLLR